MIQDNSLYLAKGILEWDAVHHDTPDQLCNAARDIVKAYSDCDFIDVVFDGPPSHKSGRFVEIENQSGASIRVGEWVDRGNGLWALRIPMCFQILLPELREKPKQTSLDPEHVHTDVCNPYYEFPITLGSIGDSPEDAWERCIEGFTQEPGDTPEEYEISCDEENQ